MTAEFAVAILFHVKQAQRGWTNVRQHCEEHLRRRNPALAPVARSWIVSLRSQ
jgi:hypothetical protein